ncbi:unnamed protein product [Lota lota]
MNSSPVQSSPGGLPIVWVPLGPQIGINEQATRVEDPSSSDQTQHQEPDGPMAGGYSCRVEAGVGVRGGGASGRQDATRSVYRPSKSRRLVASPGGRHFVYRPSKSRRLVASPAVVLVQVEACGWLLIIEWEGLAAKKGWEESWLCAPCPWSTAAGASDVKGQRLIRVQAADLHPPHHALGGEVGGSTHNRQLTSSGGCPPAPPSPVPARRQSEACTHEETQRSPQRVHQLMCPFVKARRFSVTPGPLWAHGHRAHRGIVWAH